MKQFVLPIDKYQAESFLGAIRSKKDVIILWMNAIKAFIANQPASDDDQAASLAIVIRSMSRLFCELNSGEKIFSVSFPFNTKMENSEIIFQSREGIQIDSRVSSQILSLIEGSDILDCKDFSQFIDPIFDATEMDNTLWTLIRELMLTEDAYLRYDKDSSRINGHLHPEHHIDLYYSSSGSFKIGLDEKIDRPTLVSILSIETDCHYLRPVPAHMPTNRGRPNRG